MMDILFATMGMVQFIIGLLILTAGFITWHRGDKFGVDNVNPSKRIIILLLGLGLYICVTGLYLFLLLVDISISLMGGG